MRKQYKRRGGRKRVGRKRYWIRELEDCRKIKRSSQGIRGKGNWSGRSRSGSNLSRRFTRKGNWSGNNRIIRESNWSGKSRRVGERVIGVGDLKEELEN